jgi:hypothetical protein
MVPFQLKLKIVYVPNSRVFSWLVSTASQLGPYIKQSFTSFPIGKLLFRLWGSSWAKQEWTDALCPWHDMNEASRE